MYVHFYISRNFNVYHLLIDPLLTLRSQRAQHKRLIMSALLQFVQRDENMLFEILAHFLDLRDIINFQCSKQLKTLCNSEAAETLWGHKAKLISCQTCISRNMLAIHDFVGKRGSVCYYWKGSIDLSTSYFFSHSI